MYQDLNNAIPYAVKNCNKYCIIFGMLRDKQEG